MSKRVKLAYFFPMLAVSLFLVPVSSYADIAGQQVNFNVNPKFDKLARNNLNATLRHIDDKTYFYVEDSYWNSLDAYRRDSLLNNIKTLAGQFDNVIYPKETSFWGGEVNPGIDGDPRITILLEQLIESNGGYFDTANGYSKKQVFNSNEREMLAVNAEVLLSDVFVEEMFLAHEFQHMISFNQKERTYNISEDVWLNEMRSEYSISLVGYNDNYANSNFVRRVYLFSSSPSDSLTEWPNMNIDYSNVMLFSEYLVEQYGGNILSETLHSPYTGIISLNKYLESKGYYERFGDIFIDWLGALYLNDTSINSKLGYRRAELKSMKAKPQQIVYLSQSLPEYSSVQYIKDWQPLWLEFDLGGLADDPAKSFKIDINGDSTENFLVSYLAFYGSGSVEKGRVNIVSGRGSAYVLNSSGRQLKKIVVLATKATKISGFASSEHANAFSARVSTVNSQEAKSGSLKDGMLIKRPSEKEIYVIWGKYKRYLNPGVIALYGHLNPANAIEIEPEIFDSYTTSNYVKYLSDEKVYAVWPEGSKHWLHITPSQWDASRRDWNAIFTINDLELNYYKTGLDITR